MIDKTMTITIMMMKLFSAIVRVMLESQVLCVWPLLHFTLLLRDPEWSSGTVLL